MSLPAGSRLGPYEVIGPLGSGGMGEVYRARDARLGRDVAVKVLPSAYASDPERLQRFEQEARAAAALNHPAILAVHDIGTHADAPYIVSELLEGETLRERLASGPLPVRKAVEYAVQVAHGLAAAHARGIVHRDVKPENLFLTGDGHVKILDFGLAKLTEAEGRPQLGSLPTVAVETQPGLVMGTVGYMAPEQVKGQQADHRSDVFGLGAVLYETLAGQRAFRGDTAIETMTAILKEDPPDLPVAERHIPLALTRIIDRCLEKNPGARFQSVGDLAFALEAIAGTTTAVEPVPSGVVARERRGTSARWIAAAFIAGAATGLLLALVAPFRAGEPPGPVRLSAVLPSAQVLGLGQTPALAVSPDGRTLLYGAVQGPGLRLYRRSLADGSVTPMDNTEFASCPVFSPDGQWLAFFRAGRLWKMPIGGGAPQALADASNGTGISWADEGTIVFAPSFDSPLWRVPAAGGTAEPLTKLGADEVAHAWPDVLPGGSAVIYTVEVAGQPYDNARIVVQPLPSGEPRVLIEGGTAAKYVSTGHLIYARSNALLAVPFDAGGLALGGPAVPVLQGVSSDPGRGAVRFAVSAEGTLVYVPGGGRTAQRSLVWVTREGAAQRLTDIGRIYEMASLSPDGTRVALSITDANNDLWLYDSTAGTLSRLTFEAENLFPLWTPDGRRLIFASNRAGQFNLFALSPDAAVTPERLTEHPDRQGVQSISRDGRTLVITQVNAKTGQDLWAISLDGGGAPKPVVQTPFNERFARISPDGRWLAYESNESGRFEVYVQAFPGPGAKRQISIDGGRLPQWARDGRELFFVQGETLMAAPAETGTAFRTRPARPLFSVAKYASYEPAPDGRFLMIERSEEELSTREIGVVLNWFGELKRLASPR